MIRSLALTASLALLAASSPAQISTAPAHRLPDWFGDARQVVVPTARAFPVDAGQRALHVTSGRARVTIQGRAARTELQVELSNPTNLRQEAVLLLPLPRDAVVSGFDIQGAGLEPSAALLPWSEARETYDGIVSRLRDPGLLEWAGHDLLRSSVFPVEPHGTQAVRVTFESVLEAHGDRIDYVLPRTASLDVRVPWDVELDVTATRAVGGVWSPTHDLRTTRHGARRLHARLADHDRTTPGSLRVSILLEDGGPAGTLFAYPEAGTDGGWFLFLASPPVEPVAPARREVTLVLDRSGSMAGAAWDHARAAALSVLESLREGEAFNLVDYATTVSLFAERPVRKDATSLAAARRYLDGLAPVGGTNLHGALHAALRQPATRDAEPLVLFLTDGLPTVGVLAEAEIRALATDANPHDRRVFTFGVGANVNVPLLDRVADASGALASYVGAGEHIELAVERLARRLHGPVLSDPVLSALAADGSRDTTRLHDFAPGVLPDVYANEECVVVGRYRGEGPLTVELSGRGPTGTTRARWALDLSRATVANDFVPRLWAGRRIAELVDAVRQAGADPRHLADPFSDPRLAELADEILRLSMRFGVLSEYTAFLTTEGTDLRAWDQLALSCRGTLAGRAMQVRSGAAAVNQGLNYNDVKWANNVDTRNRFVDAQLQEAELTTGVQALCDATFFKRGTRWIDAQLVGAEAEPDEVVDLGSAAHAALLASLAEQGRAALLSLPGETLLVHEGRKVLLRNDAAP